MTGINYLNISGLRINKKKETNQETKRKANSKTKKFQKRIQESHLSLDKNQQHRQH